MGRPPFRLFQLAASVAALSGFLVTHAYAGACGPQPSDPADIQTIADWIRGLQYTDPSQSSYGAVKVHNSPGFISQQGTYFRVGPYNASLGVLGLLRAPVQQKLAVAERWIRWYLGHLNMSATPPGIVFDHWYLADGSGETTCPAGIIPSQCNHDDSSAAYAATFLGASLAYYEAGGSASFLRANEKRFDTVAGVILALRQPDGLVTENRSPVKYLMDNSEAYWGLRSMEKLSTSVFRDRKAARRYSAAADGILQGINAYLYNTTTSLYRVARLGDGSFWEAGLNNWYPGTVSLVWPHLFTVTDGATATAQAQMAALNGSWDGSPNPDWTSNVVDPNGFLWPSVGHAALLAGDCARARTHADFVKARKFPGFAWPFSVDDGGWLLSTLSLLASGQ